MLRAIERGLCLNDFENMTVGMIIGYIVEYNNEHLEDEDKKDEVMQATQVDYNRF